MKKFIFFTCIGLLISAVSFASPIYGTFGCCVGDSIIHIQVDSASSSGGSWSSSNTAIATIVARGPYYATVYGVSAGVVTISYTLSGTTVTASFSVNPMPAAITGVTPFCVGSSITLSDATVGGVWSSSSAVTVGSATGVVTGVAGGGANVYYNVNPGCAASASVSVSMTYTGYIHTPYPYTLCPGSSITLAETVTGGTWSSGNTAVATINATTGVATGVTAGTVTLSYTVSGTCGLVAADTVVSVLSTTPVPTVSGPSSVCDGASISLSASVFSGTWSSSNTAIATVVSTGGASCSATGVSLGSATISYTVAGCGGPVTVPTAITVTPLNGISGHVIFSSGLSFSAPVTVWLITYNPTTLDLEAIDSTTVGVSDSSAYYQFTAVATDSYRVKATVSYDTSYLATGYIPTYHTSSNYWHDADVIYHVSGSSDINKDINMTAGSSAPGPGFIGGSVTSGANKGTSESDPVPNLLVYAINSATGAIVQQAYTNSAGSYSFTGLPLGTYLVHPELINFGTIPYTGITISSGSTSFTSASFTEHTVSHVISPGTTGVGNVPSSVSSVAVYPNPANDILNLAWNETTNETANVTLSDITGKEVFKTKVSMNAGAGATGLHLPWLENGTYMFSVKSADIDYINKVEILH